MTNEAEYIYNKPWVVDWVNKRIVSDDDFDYQSPCIGRIKQGKLVGGVVYTNYTKTSINMNVAADGDGWINRTFIRKAFAYPFIQLGCHRITALVRADNEVALRFNERLGFKREGVIRQGEEDGCDLILLGMLKDECKWLKVKE